MTPDLLPLARCLYLGPMKSMTDRCTGEVAGTWVTSMTLTARGPLTANAAGRFAMAGRVVRAPACGRDGAGGEKARHACLEVAVGVSVFADERFLLDLRQNPGRYLEFGTRPGSLRGFGGPRPRSRGSS